jgi:hypothetical protein
MCLTDGLGVWEPHVVVPNIFVSGAEVDSWLGPVVELSLDGIRIRTCTGALNCCVELASIGAPGCRRHFKATHQGALCSMLEINDFFLSRFLSFF